MVQLWCSKPRKTQIYNLPSLLFCIFKDIAVAQEKDFYHRFHIPYCISFKRKSIHNHKFIMLIDSNRKFIWEIINFFFQEYWIKAFIFQSIEFQPFKCMCQMTFCLCKRITFFQQVCI